VWNVIVRLKFPVKACNIWGIAELAICQIMTIHCK
jgi:hypothetical protein